MRVAMTVLSLLMLSGNLIDGAIIAAFRDGSLWQGNVDEWFLVRLTVEVGLGVIGAVVSARCIFVARCDGAERAVQRARYIRASLSPVGD